MRAHDVADFHAGFQLGILHEGVGLLLQRFQLRSFFGNQHPQFLQGQAALGLDPSSGVVSIGIHVPTIPSVLRSGDLTRAWLIGLFDREFMHTTRWFWACLLIVPAGCSTPPAAPPPTLARTSNSPAASVWTRAHCARRPSSTTCRSGNRRAERRITASCGTVGRS